ncbi:uncharacterized protein LOC124553699 [Schistocerca americana]|uniref:uncharacterized protein LOC124553699 n=1 Tax=Schistocerca americana TaxID=7009 RepID=UPI001F4F876F|nr:uncharacterized protein LOC124553699 [Schistocerca americana]
MDVKCEVGSSDGNCCYTDSSSSSELNEDNDRRDQGVEITKGTLNSILDDNSRTFEFLRSFGVLADKYICATCRKPMSCTKVPPKRSRDQLMWRCRKHNVWRSVRKGTWFESARLTIRAIVLMTYCFCMRKSVLSTSRIAGLSDRSALDWFLSCREICSALLKRRGKIGGPGVVVEMDELPFRRVKYDLGKWMAEVWVWGAVVCGKEHGQLVLKMVEKRNARTLQSLLEEHIEDGTVICSDKWKSYEDEGEVDLQTFAADHNYQFRNKLIGTMEQHWEGIQRVVGRGKRRLGSLQGHLDEYVWRESVFGQGCVFHSFMRGVGTLYVPCVEDPTPALQDSRRVAEHSKPAAGVIIPVAVKREPSLSATVLSSPLAAGDASPAAVKREPSLSPDEFDDLTPVAVKEEPSLSAAGPSSPVEAAVNVTLQPKERPTRHRKRLVREDFWYPTSFQDFCDAELED